MRMYACVYVCVCVSVSVSVSMSVSVWLNTCIRAHPRDPRGVVECEGSCTFVVPLHRQAKEPAMTARWPATFGIQS